MTAHDLKPCPFCGGEARIETVNHDYGVTYSVGCFGSGRCGASFTLFDHRNDAIATWNRRTLSTITPAEVGGLVGDLYDACREEADGLKRKLLRAAATALEAKEAELAEAKTHLDCALHRAKIAQQNMNAEINARERAEAALAEARKALEPFAAVADLIDSETEGMSETDELELHFHDYLMASWPVSVFRAARRALGGKKDG